MWRWASSQIFAASHRCTPRHTAKHRRMTLASGARKAFGGSNLQTASLLVDGAVSPVDDLEMHLGVPLFDHADFVGGSPA